MQHQFTIGARPSRCCRLFIRLLYKASGILFFILMLLNALQALSTPALALTGMQSAQSPNDGQAAGEHTIKLNGALVPGGNVSDSQLTSDGQWVVYKADQETDEIEELYSVPISGGTPIKLNPTLVAGGSVNAFKISPDGSRVVYWADQEMDDFWELYSVPITGGSAVKLNAPLQPGFRISNLRVSFVISPDSRRVVYQGFHLPGTLYAAIDLYSVPIEGGTPIRLNGPTLDKVGVQACGFPILTCIQISQDSHKVVYLADEGAFGVYELHSVPIDGGSATKLNAPLPEGGAIKTFYLDQDSDRVVYLADQATKGVDEIYSVPLGGGNAIKLNSPLTSGGNVVQVAISPDSKQVVYRADQAMDEVFELYSVPIVGGDVIKLNSVLPSGGKVLESNISQDGRFVVYRTYQDTDGNSELHGVQIEGGNVTQLAAGIFSGFFKLSSNSKYVVYRAGDGVGEKSALYSVPILGGVPTQLNSALAIGGSILDFSITLDSRRVVYHADPEANGIVGLYSVKTVGGSSTVINKPVAPGHGYSDFRFAPDNNRVVYRTDHQGTDEVVELYSALLPATGLDITKRVNTSTAQPGNLVTYSLVVAAQGGFAPVVITDTLPAGVTLTNISSPDWEYDFEHRQLKYRGELEPNTPLSLTYTTRISSAVGPGSILYGEAVATTFGETYFASAAVVVPQPPSAKIPTLNLVYANGDNNLSEHMMQLFQKAELAADNTTMITLILVDQAEIGDAILYRVLPDSDQFENCPTLHNPTCGGRYQDNVNMWYWGEAVSTASSLAEFVENAIRTYPADRITLSLVGHGGGWSPDLYPGEPSFHDGKGTDDELGGLLWDDHPVSSLSTRELGDALRRATTRTNRKIDLLYLDACLMAMSEVAYEVRDSADYLLASENWSWTSLRYDLHFALDGNLAPEELGRRWILNEAEELIGQGTRPNYPFTYSLLRLSAMDELLLREDDLARALINRLRPDSNNPAQIEDAKRRIHSAFLQNACFDGDQDYALLPGDTDDFYCDLSSFAQNLRMTFEPDSPVFNAAGALAAVISDTVRVDTLQVAELHNNGRPYQRPEYLWAWNTLGGVSKYMPLGVDHARRTYYTPTYLRSTGPDSPTELQIGLWDEFLAAYWGSEPPAILNFCGSSCTPPAPLELLDELYLPVLQK